MGEKEFVLGAVVELKSASQRMTIEGFGSGPDDVVMVVWMDSDDHLQRAAIPRVCLRVKEKG